MNGKLSNRIEKLEVLQLSNDGEPQAVTPGLSTPRPESVEGYLEELELEKQLGPEGATEERQKRYGLPVGSCIIGTDRGELIYQNGRVVGRWNEEQRKAELFPGERESGAEAPQRTEINGHGSNGSR